MLIHLEQITEETEPNGICGTVTLKLTLEWVREPFRPEDHIHQDEDSVNNGNNIMMLQRPWWIDKSLDSEPLLPSAIIQEYIDCAAYRKCYPFIRRDPDVDITSRPNEGLWPRAWICPKCSLINPIVPFFTAVLWTCDKCGVSITNCLNILI